MPLMLGRSFSVSTRRSREDEKSTLLEILSTFEKESNGVFTFSIDGNFCLLGFEITYGNQQSQFMNFQCIDDLKGPVVVLKLSIDSPQSPPPLLNSSRQKVESNHCRTDFPRDIYL